MKMKKNLLEARDAPILSLNPFPELLALSTFIARRLSFHTRWWWWPYVLAAYVSLSMDQKGRKKNLQKLETRQMRLEPLTSFGPFDVVEKPSPKT